MQQKTKRYACIDLSLTIHKDMTCAILAKYDHAAPCTLDLSDFDKYLHALMVACGFSEDIQFEHSSNGDIITTHKHKYSLITSHTARRTFVTFNALRGIPALAIMRATGHKTFEAFQKYLRY